MLPLPDNFLDHLFNESDAPLIFSLTLDLKYKYFNQPYIELVQKLNGEKIEIGSNYIELNPEETLYDYLSNAHPLTLTKCWDKFYSIYIFPNQKEGKVDGINVIATPLNEEDIHKDITEYKETNEILIKTKEELNQTLDQLNLVLDTTNLGVWRYDNKNQRMTWNENLSQIYERSDTFYDGPFEQHHKNVVKEDKKYVKNMAIRLKQGHKISNARFRIKTPSGSIKHILSSKTPFLDKNGAFSSAIGVYMDITSVVENEEKLQTSIEQLELAAKTAKLGFFKVSNSSDPYINREMINIWGVTIKDVLSYPKNWWVNYIFHEDYQKTTKTYEKLRSGQEVNDFRFRILTKKDELKYISLSGTPIKNELGHLDGYVGINMDVTSLTKNEERLRAHIKQHDLGAKAAKIGFFGLSKDASKRYASKEMEVIWGVKFEEMEKHSGKWWLPYVIDEDKPNMTECFEKLLNGEDVDEERFTIITKNKKKKHLVVSGTPIFDNWGNFTSSIGMIMDITRLVKNEEKLIKTIESKNVLFQELHHRIKNNLQMVSSIVHLKSRMIKDESTRNFAKDINARILSVASIHELLLNLEDTNRINIRKYLLTIVNKLVDAYNNEQKNIELKYNIQELKIDIDTALTLGFIVHEIVSNSIEHAFIGLPSGLITINFALDQEGYQLFISDNGVGMKTISHKKSVGTNLIETLVEKLDGTMISSYNDGFSYTIYFQENQ